jgi:hypothetical protein
MQELSARAALVSAPDVAGGLSTSVSREEVEDALRAEDGPVDLILDVTRYSDGEPAETRSVAVAWERPDLEQLLTQTGGDRIILTFDGETLAQAMADVEAHGLREKILVLAVAATAAAGAASTATAQVVASDVGGGSGAAPVVQTGVSPDDRAVPRSTSTEGQIGVSPDDRAVPRSVTEQPTGVSPDDRAVPRSTPVATPTASEPGGGIDWTGPTEIVAIAGGMLLAITGAAFVVAGRRRVRPQPG